MSLNVLTESDVTPANTCIFCKKNTVDELRFGPLYHRDGVTTHYFCLLLSPGIFQRGNDDQGILGFLPVDISKEVRRSSRLECFYCEEVGASIGCCNKRCRKAFHYPCGLINGTNYQFYGTFESYCEDHKKVQKISLKVSDWNCPVCMCEVSASEGPIQASCCKAAVFHKDCIQKVALNAGYFFKCPTCNACEEFTQEMRSLGIYVPQQDASWEREPNAYEELLYQYSKCDAVACECEQGREHVEEKGNWTLARCQICGAAGMHKRCGNLRNIGNWACDGCVEIEKKADLEKKRIKQENARKQKESAANLVGQENEEDATTDDDFKMADVKISESCYQYFPYDKEDLQKYATKESIPDWRNLQLTVNLTSWIKCVPVTPQVCCSKSISTDDDDKKKRGAKPNTIAVDDEAIIDDIIHDKLINKAARLITVAKEIQQSMEISIIREKENSAEYSDAVTEMDTSDTMTDKDASDTVIGNDSFDTVTDKNVSDSMTENSYSDAATEFDSSGSVVEKDSISVDNNANLTVSRPEKNSVEAKPKCSIFPFVSNFLKSGMFVREKRKHEINKQSGASPPKKALICEESGNEKETDTDVGGFAVKTPIGAESDELNVPNNATSAEKQVVLWKKNDLQHASPKTLKFSKELKNLFQESPSPQSLVISCMSSRVEGLSMQSRFPAITSNAFQSLTGSRSDKDFLHIADDLTIPSSRRPSSEPEETGRPQNSLALAVLSPKSPTLHGESKDVEDNGTGRSPPIANTMLREVLLSGSGIEENEDLKKSQIIS